MLIFIISFVLIIILLKRYNDKNYHSYEDYVREQKEAMDLIISQRFSEQFGNKYKLPVKNKILEKYLHNSKLMYEPLDYLQEIEYSEKIQNGDKNSYESFLSKHLNIVPKIVEELNTHGLHGKLINVGNQGLIEAVRSYDGKVRFTQYADKFIRNNIKREIKVNSSEYSQPYQEEQPIVPRHRVCLTCASRSN
ncbi:hypothetical protein OAJ56_02435 [Flavobacteriales bacterium]|nr:hypothetical protein [Flavobacteriales bacterium]